MSTHKKSWKRPTNLFRNLLINIYFSGKAHLREALLLHEEAMRVNRMCRELRKKDMLQDLLRSTHDRSLNKYASIDQENDFQVKLDYITSCVTKWVGCFGCYSTSASAPRPMSVKFPIISSIAQEHIAYIRILLFLPYENLYCFWKMSCIIV